MTKRKFCTRNRRLAMVCAVRKRRNAMRARHPVPDFRFPTRAVRFLRQTEPDEFWIFNPIIRSASTY